MTRKYTRFADDKVKYLLGKLADDSTSPEEYRGTMYKLGQTMGEFIVEQEGGIPTELFVACTVEDADFLAKGVIDVAEASPRLQSVRFACFWNERITVGDSVSAAPIVKRYCETSAPAARHVLVIIKSIVASGCVVRTNLTNLIQKLEPETILIAAPVMLEGAEESLTKEFRPEISNKFEFVTYAIDSDRTENGEVRPGIGGNVYKRLGFNSQEAKNQIVPNLVQTRRRIFSQLTTREAPSSSVGI